MPPAAERLEVFLIWGSSDRRNSHAGEQVRVDLLAEPRIETLEALADRAKLEFCMEARPQLLHTRTFNPIESMAELINKGDVVVVPPDEKGVMLPIKPKLMCNVINTAKNGATATVALQELIENCIEAIRRVAPGHLGSITIDVAYDPETKTFTITIRDNGFGINSSEIERVVTFGYSKHENKAKDQEHRIPKMQILKECVRGMQDPMPYVLKDPLALDGFFGKYGIGFKSSFVFGEEVQIDLRSKQAGEKVQIDLRSKQAGEKVAYAVLNWQEMQRSDGEYVANIGVEEHTLGAVTNEHWTEVTLQP
ncbi:histidine kinase-DNA gyrase B-and HSP90-like ATPase-domain-containing protein [Baffinella frigidus]|nr:histidine kinase-DNA gyrase B-and HSP90-like ATPase-domain-containing protein [Cryptophyta sp. CCMP2293]